MLEGAEISPATAGGDSVRPTSAGTDALETAGEKNDTCMNTCSELSELAKLMLSP